MSIAGGLHMAFERIASVDGTALQIFTRNQRQWKIPPLTDYDVELFAMAWSQWGDHPIAAHDSYLINLASNKRDLAQRSRIGFAEELRRVERLGVEFLVTHPGSHLGDGVEAGIDRYVAGLDAAVRDSGTEKAIILLETTAGQGTNLGSTFEELARIIELSDFPERIGVCFDTCHAFAAGYDIRTESAYAETMDRFDETVGLDRLKFFHVNDSKTPFGSNKDRHEHIGQGEIGLDGFRNLLQDPRFFDVPKTLETPKEVDLEDDRKNLALLRTLAEEAA